MKQVLILLSLLSLSLLLSACGKRGPLIAPEALAPAPIKDLAVEQKGVRFQVCWSAPAKEEWGGRLEDLAGFRVFRRVVLPPDEDCETCPTAYGLLRDVDPEYLRDVQRFGSLFCFFDTDLIDGRTYQYKVLSFDAEGAESKDSNKIRRTKTVPVAPPELRAEPAPRGVVLRWTPAKLPAGAVAEGYSVYRKQGEEAIPLFPMVLVPAGENSFEDPSMEHGVLYRYAVRTVATLDGQRVESVLSNEVEGVFSLSE